MKRFWAGMVAVGLLTAACGGGDGETSDDTSNEGDVAAEYFEDCNNTIEMVIGYTAGGATDTWSRILADAMAAETGAEFNVVNTPGAGGSLGINDVISAEPDGCTIGNINLPSGLQYLFPNSEVTYTRDDLALIGETGYSANAIVVSAESEYETVADLIADAEARPGEVNAASDGVASDDAVAYIQLEDAVGVTFNQVVLDGSADKVTSLLGGQVDLFGGSITGVLPQIRNDQIRILCVYAEEPSAFVPDAPTCPSEGVDVVSDNRWSLMTGAEVPEERRQVLEDVMMTVADDPEYQAANEEVGIEVVTLTGEELSAEWDRQAAVYEEITARMG